MIRTKLVLIFLILYSLLLAEDNQQALLKKSTIESAKYFDINRITMAVQNNGVFANDPETRHCGLWYDEVSLIWISGLWLAAKVDSQVRASASDYLDLTDFIGSAINEQGNPFGKEDSTFRVFKISTGDNEFNNPDYAEWQRQAGAPVDKNDNPWLIGDQTLWCSFTDAYEEDRKYNPCQPMNAEIHLTTWGSKILDNVVFMRWEIFNKGDKLLQNAYAGIFVDADICFANNNLVGSDSTLSMVYTFEHTGNQQFDSTYAVGVVVLESPIIESFGDTAITFYGPLPDYKNTDVLSPLVYKHNPYEWALPSHGENYAKYWIYRRLAGKDTDGNLMINPITGKSTTWGLSGDPIIKTGWIDEQPYDRFMMISTGPFDVAAGDTNAMTIAIIAVTDSNYFGTVPALKKRAGKIRTYFRDSLHIITGVNYRCLENDHILDFGLFQNYPNPFNSSTQIAYCLKEGGKINLTIFNINGQKVKILYNGFKEAGVHKITWDGTNDAGNLVSSGLFFYQLRQKNKIITKKMLYLK